MYVITLLRLQTFPLFDCHTQTTLYAHSNTYVCLYECIPLKRIHSESERQSAVMKMFL